jgi:hypothetical protein
MPSIRQGSRLRPQAAVWSLLLLAAIVIFASQPVLAQEISAGITGRVVDPTGAAVVGATVTARDVNRGTTWPTKTNEEGIFAFPRIPVGSYELKVEATGFKTSVRSDITLELNQRARIDLTLELGTLTESVQVSGEAPLLSTETTIVGSLLTANSIINTPLMTRNFIMLTLLTPGVTTTDPSAFMNGQRTAGGGRPYVNGNRKEANNFLLDGIDNNLTSDNLTSYQPNLDAIQEVKMITNNASAEFGNFQGGVINVNLKSGTNEFHGNVFEFFRNDKLNANNWGRNWSLQPDPKTGKAPRSPIRWNEFGGTIGGPIKKDKLFFFGDYQGIRRYTPASIGTRTQMSAAWRNGDFSNLLPATQLYDPGTTDASGNRQPFANNQIPVARRDIVATNLFNSQDLYPLPMRPDLRNNYDQASRSQLISDQFDGKVDTKLTDKDDLSVRYSWGRQESPSFTSFPLTFPSFNHAPFQNGVINWTRTLSPTKVNELRIGVNRVTLWNGGQDKGIGNVAEKLGIQNGNERGPGLLSLQGWTYASAVGSANIGTQQKFPNNTFHYADNFTIIHGRHMMKLGGNLLRQQMNPFYAGNNGRTGFINFDGHFTSNPNPRSTGLPEADFFLGDPNRTGRGLNTGAWGQRKIILGFYFQDDWHATNELTLNLGLRWEEHTPLVEVKDRQSNFDPFTGKLELAGKDGNSRALYNPFKKDFQPRVGFAWTPKALGGKTVFRGAYTISSFMEGTGTNLRLPMNPPFNVEFEIIHDKTTPGQTTEQGLTLVSNTDPYKGSNIRLWDPNVRPANVQQWSLIIERQFPSQMVATLGYIGQHGTHLVVPMPYFQKRLVGPGQVVPSPYLSGNPLLAGITQISGTESNGTQRYDSLQATLRKRLTTGLEFQLNYTFSKGMSDAIGYYGEGGQAASQSAYWQYLYDRKAEWGPTYFDSKHMFTGVYTYELPFGKGKRFGSNWHPAVNGVLGGWQLGGILTLHTGFPLTITATDRSGTTSRGARADRIGNGEGPKQVGQNNSWLDRSAFKEPAAGTLGNSGVGVVRGPGWKSTDLTLQKFFRITERKRLELRAETFNLTNTPQFSAPNRNASSATFGEITGAQGDRNIQIALKLYF